MELLKQENVRICDAPAHWQDAIRISVEPLVEGGYVEDRYSEEIIANLDKFGPYIVIADNIALPHARAEQGVLKTQLAVTLFREPVYFDGKDMPARLFVTLAAADVDSHQDALCAISEMLGNEETLEKILNAENAEILYNCFC